MLLATFKRVMRLCSVDETCWVLKLAPQLTGKVEVLQLPAEGTHCRVPFSMGGRHWGWLTGGAYPGFKEGGAYRKY